VAAHSRTSAWCIFGDRTGIGLVIDGSVHRGFRGAAGEVVEAGAMGASRMEDTPFGRLTSPRHDEREDALAAVAAARAGDPDVLRELDAFAAHLAELLSTLAWTVSPDLFVLGGGLEDAEDPLSVELARHLTGPEAYAVRARVELLLHHRVHPYPSPDWPSVPWPPV